MADQTTLETTETNQSTKEYIMEYINNFRSSPEVTTQVEQRWTRAQGIDQTVTRDEVEERFLNTEDGKEAFWTFYRSHPFEVDTEKFSSEFRAKINNYYAQIRGMDLKQRHMVYVGNRGAIEDDEVRRSNAHTQAARQLVAEGIAPNLTLARLLVHFITINDGLDSPDPARDERRRRALKEGL